VTLQNNIFHTSKFRLLTYFSLFPTCIIGCCSSSSNQKVALGQRTLITIHPE
jgi:hypothetical protein